MKDLLEQKSGLGETALISPILLMLQAEKLKNRGCGSGDYDYVEYYVDGNGDINGFLDQVVITPDGGYTEDYDWNINDWGQGYPDDDYAVIMMMTIVMIMAHIMAVVVVMKIALLQKTT